MRKISGGVPTITFQSTANDLTAQTTYTFTSMALGAANASRQIYVLVFAGVNNSQAASVTVGGASLSLVTASSSVVNGTITEIWSAAVSAGTSADVVVTLGGAGQNRCGVAVYSAIGTSPSASAGASNQNASAVTTLGATATVPASGGAIAVLNVHNSASTALAISNVTLDTAIITMGNSAIVFGHSTPSPGSTTFTSTWATAADAAMSVVTVNP